MRSGTCPVCGQIIAIVNYRREPWGEGGYLARHGRTGIARNSKCRGSFGPWAERVH